MKGERIPGDDEYTLVANNTFVQCSIMVSYGPTGISRLCRCRAIWYTKAGAAICGCHRAVKDRWAAKKETT